VKILVINGPNINMLGIREPGIYGKNSFSDLLKLLDDTAREENIEIEQFITVLDEFVKASTNAIAFSVMDQRKYSQSRVEDKINQICASLGIETARAQSNGRGGSYNRSFFNSSASDNGNSGYSANSVSYGSASIDDLE